MYKMVLDFDKRTKDIHEKIKNRDDQVCGEKKSSALQQGDSVHSG